MEGKISQFPSALKTLPPDLADRLRSISTVIQARHGRTIVSLGESSSHVFLVLQGRVQVTLISLNGREVILSDLTEGSFFGELAAIDEEPRSASVVALSNCILACIPAQAFRAAITETPSAALWMARRLAAQVRELTEKVFELNALRVRDRLYCELLRMCGPPDGKVAIIEPAPTHAELASRIGTHREAVTREMGYLAEEGLLAQSRKKITVLDLPALATLVRVATGNLNPELHSLAPDPVDELQRPGANIG